MGEVSFEMIDAERSWVIFDQAARRLLGIDGSTFARRWDEGSFAYEGEVGDVMKVAMLRPSAETR